MRAIRVVKHGRNHEYTKSPMFLRYLDLVDIHIIVKPSLLFLNRQIIPTHLPLPHLSFCVKSPVFEAIAPMPSAGLPVLIFIPELYGNLFIGFRQYELCIIHKKWTLLHTLLSVKANNSFRSL